MTNNTLPSIADRVKHIQKNLDKFYKFIKMDVNKDKDCDKTHTLSYYFNAYDIPRKCYYNSKRHILIENSYKTASRSLDGLMRISNVKEEWQELYRKRDEDFFTDIISSPDIEIHTIVRDPMARLASAIKMFSYYHLPSQYGLALDLESVVLNSHIKYSLYDHFTPQYLGVFINENQKELHEAIKQNTIDTFERITQDTSMLEHYLAIYGSLESIINKYCAGWYANQHLVDLSKIKSSTKYYWVQDTLQEEDLAEANHINVLVKNLNLDIDLYSDSYKQLIRTKIGKGKETDIDTLDMMYHYSNHFKAQALEIPNDFKWIDSLTFENTSDGKPVYTINPFANEPGI